MALNIKIEGMTCSGCVNAVRRVLEATEGVTAVSVDLEGGRATLETRDDVNPASLVSAIEDAGYEARIEA